MSKKLAKRPKNLSLDPEAVSRGEAYSELHGTNLSRLVGDFLHSLPLKETEPPLRPVVKRLRGIGVGSKANRLTHREHLVRKYGGR